MVKMICGSHRSFYMHCLVTFELDTGHHGVMDSVFLCEPWCYRFKPQYRQAHCNFQKTGSLVIQFSHWRWFSSLARLTAVVNSASFPLSRRMSSIVPAVMLRNKYSRTCGHVVLAVRGAECIVEFKLNLSIFVCRIYRFHWFYWIFWTTRTIRSNRWYG